MRRTFISLTLGALVVGAALVGTTALAGEFYTKHPKSDELHGQATADAALVYVIRSGKLGAAVRTWAFYDDSLIGVSRSSGYAFALVPPGERLFWSKAENTSALKLNVEAGRTYYFRQKILPGFGKARVKLQSLDEEEGKKALRKCGWAEPTEAANARASEIIANRLERAQHIVANAPVGGRKGGTP